MEIEYSNDCDSNGDNSASIVTSADFDMAQFISKISSTSQHHLTKRNPELLSQLLTQAIWILDHDEKKIHELFGIGMVHIVRGILQWTFDQLPDNHATTSTALHVSFLNVIRRSISEIRQQQLEETHGGISLNDGTKLLNYLKSLVSEKESNGDVPQLVLDIVCHLFGLRPQEEDEQQAMEFSFMFRLYRPPLEKFTSFVFALFESQSIEMVNTNPVLSQILKASLKLCHLLWDNQGNKRKVLQSFLVNFFHRFISIRMDSAHFNDSLRTSSILDDMFLHIIFQRDQFERYLSTNVSTGFTNALLDELEIKKLTGYELLFNLLALEINKLITASPVTRQIVMDWYVQLASKCIQLFKKKDPNHSSTKQMANAKGNEKKRKRSSKNAATATNTISTASSPFWLWWKVIHILVGQFRLHPQEIVFAQGIAQLCRLFAIENIYHAMDDDLQQSQLRAIQSLCPELCSISGANLQLTSSIQSSPYSHPLIAQAFSFLLSQCGNFFPSINEIGIHLKQMAKYGNHSKEAEMFGLFSAIIHNYHSKRCTVELIQYFMQWNMNLSKEEQERNWIFTSKELLACIERSIGQLSSSQVVMLWEMAFEQWQVCLEKKLDRKYFAGMINLMKCVLHHSNIVESIIEKIEALLHPLLPSLLGNCHGDAGTRNICISIELLYELVIFYNRHSAWIDFPDRLITLQLVNSIRALFEKASSCHLGLIWMHLIKKRHSQNVSSLTAPLEEKDEQSVDMVLQWIIKDAGRSKKYRLIQENLSLISFFLYSMEQSSGISQLLVQSIPFSHFFSDASFYEIHSSFQMVWIEHILSADFQKERNVQLLCSFPFEEYILQGDFVEDQASTISRILLTLLSVGQQLNGDVGSLTEGMPSAEQSLNYQLVLMQKLSYLLTSLQKQPCLPSFSNLWTCAIHWFSSIQASNCTTVNLSCDSQSKLKELMKLCVAQLLLSVDDHQQQQSLLMQWYHKSINLLKAKSLNRNDVVIFLLQVISSPLFIQRLKKSTVWADWIMEDFLPLTSFHKKTDEGEMIPEEVFLMLNSLTQVFPLCTLQLNQYQVLVQNLISATESLPEACHVPSLFTPERRHQMQFLGSNLSYVLEKIHCFSKQCQLVVLVFQSLSSPSIELDPKLVYHGYLNWIKKAIITEEKIAQWFELLSAAEKYSFADFQEDHIRLGWKEKLFLLFFDDLWKRKMKDKTLLSQLRLKFLQQSIRPSLSQQLPSHIRQRISSLHFGAILCTKYPSKEIMNLETLQTMYQLMFQMMNHTSNAGKERKSASTGEEKEEIQTIWIQCCLLQIHFIRQYPIWITTSCTPFFVQLCFMLCQSLFANQSCLTFTCSYYLSQLFSSLKSHEPIFRKPGIYLVQEYFHCQYQYGLQQSSTHQRNLRLGMYSLFDLFTLHEFEQLQKQFSSDSEKHWFQELYQDYQQLYKYQGR